MKFKILHITPHMGGGVGTVLRSFLKYEHKNKHKVYSLDTVNTISKDFFNKYNIIFKDNLYKDYFKILAEIKKTDIVVIHWWNHPLLYEYIINYPLPKCRLAIWSHVSGIKAPQIFNEKVFNYPDKFIFTTPISYKSELFINYSGDKNKFSDIWSTTSLKKFKNIKKKEQKEFTIGYIGAIDFAKLHPNFIDICKSINIPNVKFIICGDGSDLVKLKDQVKENNIEKKFEFTGFIENIKPYLSKFDLFLYPLNPNHYGTCDQALTEAMASGTAPVVLNNPMEEYIVHNSYTGKVCNSIDEIINTIKELYFSKEEKERLANNAKKEAIKRFEVKSMIKEWHEIYRKISRLEKTEKIWPKIDKSKKLTPHELFLEAINYDKDFLEKSKKLDEWKSNTKGTLFHYSQFFKDKIIEDWKDEIKS